MTIENEDDEEEKMIERRGKMNANTNESSHDDDVDGMMSTELLTVRQSSQSSNLTKVTQGLNDTIDQAIISQNIDK